MTKKTRYVKTAYPEALDITAGKVEEADGAISVLDGALWYSKDSGEIKVSCEDSWYSFNIDKEDVKEIAEWARKVLEHIDANEEREL